jgi:hypothetical protein
MRLFRRVTGWASALLMALVVLGGPGSGFGTWECWAASSPAEWDQPAGRLAEQIAGIVGPGQATLSVRNLSSIPDAQVAAIRASIEKNLKSHGVTIASGESANTVRVTLSQNDRERLWVAEIIQGNETRVVMAEAGPGAAHTGALTDYLTLRREHLPVMLNTLPGVVSDTPVLSALETNSTMVLLRPEGLELYSFSEGGWMHPTVLNLGPHGGLSRDARGILVASADRSRFTAYSAGSECTGQYTAPGVQSGASPGSDWNIHCQKSDEPWPILQSGAAANPVTIKAFYNAARNYFTGVITPSLGVDLPPFYSAALLSRANGMALLVGTVDGKVQMVENGALKPVSGARDWGSDFAVLNSGCGSGAQVIASGSGEAASDSLRAYELPGLEAVPASAPLSMNGTVMAIWPSPDGKSLLAAVRSASGDYEVDRVTALCN